MTSPGGYRPPLNPSAVSGPGALSARTDGASPPVPSGLPYGDRQAMQASIQANPIRPQGGAPSAPTPSAIASAAPTQAPPLLSDPSMNPDQPVTAGAPVGAGPGPEALAQTSAPPPGTLAAILAKLAANDTSGGVADLMVEAMRAGG